ncbi:DNA-binding protein [Secundilactobacillus muriivasis]
MINANELLSIRQAMQILGVRSYNTFRNNYLNCGLPCVVVGKSRKVDVNDLRKFVDDHKVSEVK